MLGKTIRIFLADGHSNGLQICEIMNWTGKVLVASRNSELIANLKKRPEVSQPGIYILSGTDLEASIAKEKIYIGQSDNVLERLKNHLADTTKDFWERTIIIVSKDSNLTKSHVLYLESKMIKLALEARRATVANGNQPPPPTMPETDIADMDYFLTQVQMLLPVLGFPFATPIPINTATTQQISGANVTDNNVVQPSSPLFVFTTGNITAQAQEIQGEFIVMKDSLAKISTGALGNGYMNLRSQLRADGKLIEHQSSNNLIFTEDVPFKSTSAAAAIIAGNNINGTLSWKVKETGQTYKDWQAAKNAV